MDGYMILKDKAAEIIIFVVVAMSLSVLLMNAGDMPMGTQEEAWQWMYGCWAVVLALYFICMLVKKGRELLYDYVGDMAALALMLYGIVEAVWGLAQLWGWLPSNHARFAVTGSFANPGPYSGFLAMVFPLAYSEYISRTYRDIHKPVALVAMISIVLVLPAGMSRTAWIAALVSTGCMYYLWNVWKIDEYYPRYEKPLKWVIGIVAVLILVGAGAGLYYLKKDSADGRVLMWKVAATALQEHPLEGNGWNGVPAVYGQAQEDYFAMGDYTETEARVADAPEYVFNEYLQVALAWGIPVLVGACLIIGCCLNRLYENFNYGLYGALLAFLIFAFASYPLQYPSMVAVLALLVLSAISVVLRWQDGWYWIAVLLIGSGCVVSFIKYGDKKYVAELYRSWGQCQMLYNAGLYERAAEKYGDLYKRPYDACQYMNWNPRFLFEYARSLHKIGMWDESTAILKEASKVSGDPMILNLIGKNESAMYRFDSAERYYLRAANRVPSRIYPYYLMVKLFSYRDNYQPDKLREAARVVLTKEPKVPSTAVRQMKEETRRILEEKQIEL